MDDNLDLYHDDNQMHQEVLMGIDQIFHLQYHHQESHEYHHLISIVLGHFEFERHDLREKMP